MRYNVTRVQINHLRRYTINEYEQIEQWYLHKDNDDGTVTLRKNFKLSPNAILKIYPISEVFETLHQAHLHKEK